MIWTFLLQLLEACSETGHENYNRSKTPPTEKHGVSLRTSRTRRKFPPFSCTLFRSPWSTSTCTSGCSRKKQPNTQVSISNVLSYVVTTISDPKLFVRTWMKRAMWWRSIACRGFGYPWPQVVVFAGNSWKFILFLIWMATPPPPPFWRFLKTSTYPRNCFGLSCRRSCVSVTNIKSSRGLFANSLYSLYRFLILFALK